MTTQTDLTCSVCFHEGPDVHEHDVYSRVLGRDTTDYLCDDGDACHKRAEPATGPGLPTVRLAGVQSQAGRQV